MHNFQRRKKTILKALNNQIEAVRRNVIRRDFVYIFNKTREKIGSHFFSLFIEKQVKLFVHHKMHAFVGNYWMIWLTDNEIYRWRRWLNGISYRWMTGTAHCCDMIGLLNGWTPTDGPHVLSRTYLIRERINMPLWMKPSKQFQNPVRVYAGARQTSANSTPATEVCACTAFLLAFERFFSFAHDLSFTKTAWCP